jgi:hypothetical protein
VTESGTVADTPSTTGGGHRAPAPKPNRGVLVVPVLLVAALVLLVIGLVSSSSAWLAASLVASVLAAVVLVVERVVQTRRASRRAGRAADAASTAAGSSAATATASSTDDDAEPAPPLDLDAPAIDPDDPEAVWVVDGRPRYHVRDCATIASLDAEPIPRSQALEDGFVACSLCDPGTPSARTPAGA